MSAPSLPAFRVTNATEDIPAVQRPRQTGPNPLTEHVKRSYDQKKTKQVVIPADSVNEVVNLIRRGAASLGLGVRVFYPHTVETYKAKGRDGAEKDAKRWVPTPDADGTVVVKFIGKDKSSKKDENDAPADESAPADSQPSA